MPSKKGAANFKVPKLKLMKSLPIQKPKLAKQITAAKTLRGIRR